MDVLGLMFVGAGAAAIARWYQRRSAPAIPVRLSPDADVALHVAKHEASARGQVVSALHVVYGLLQDEAFAAALTRAGGDPESAEARVHAELDRRGAAGSGPDRGDELRYVVERAFLLAYQYKRDATIADLWRYLARTDAAHVVEGGTTTAFGVLFALVHATTEPALPAALLGPVNVVLRNDDYTPRDFVIALLRDVFELADEPAEAVTMATHESGRAVVGRLGGAAARTKILTARTRAREHGFPLWIDAEPC